jgi:3-methyladenine DNA glycosylase AlkC
MEPFKNLINEKTAKGIELILQKNGIEIDRKKFLKACSSELHALELKARVIFIADLLHEEFEKKKLSYKKIGNALEKAFLQEQIKPSGHIIGFQAWPILEYVAKYGIKELDISQRILKAATVVFTSEFAVRPFLKEYEKDMLDFMFDCSQDKNEHIRRLASEGTRPLLPWGMKLESFVLNPHKTMPILENLKSDESLYVRKSVANHLNDHSKHNSEMVLKVLKKWKKEFAPKHPKHAEVSWIIKHALRTLIKKNHPEAFSLIGIKPSKIDILSASIKKSKIKLGQVLEVEVVLINREKDEVNFVLDHDIHLLKQNGSHNIKCFKGTKGILAKGETKKLTLNIPIKAVTTRKYYSGKHFWCVKINGNLGENLSFQLDV